MLLRKIFMGMAIVSMTCFLILCGALSFFAVRGVSYIVDMVSQTQASEHGPDYEVHIKEEWSAKDLQELQIGTSATDIQLRVVDSDKISIQLDGHYKKEEPLQIVKQHNKLILQVEESNAQNLMFNTLQNSVRTKELLVMIPAKLTLVLLKTTSGDISLASANIEQLVASTVSGDIAIDHSHLQSVSLTTVSGDMHVSNQAEQLQLNSVSGDIRINLVNSDVSFAANTVSGDVAISFATAPDVTVNYSTVSGSIKISGVPGALVEGGSLKTKLGSGAGTLQVKTISGDFRLTAKAP